MEDLLEDTVLIQLRINGKYHELEISPSVSLLDLLRDELNFKGTHMGCMTGHCGACTVMINGKTAKSCITLASTLSNVDITTIEGLSDEEGNLSPLQESFWNTAGFQCGYCAPGMLLLTKELLEDNPNPTDDEIKTALEGTLCRCTGYQSLIRAVKDAAENISASKS